jgi:hypothetical protein
MTDNFDKILPLLEFPTEDNFYFVQILQRKKDHPGINVGGSNNNSRLIKSYHINSPEKLMIYKDEMIAMADLFQARVGINLNPRSFEKTAYQLLIKVSNQMQNKDFYNIRKSYDSVCGNYHSEIDKRWLVDVDKGEFHLEARLKYIKDTINDLHSEIANRDYKILATLPTKNGYHIITHPFNLAKFREIVCDVEVHKNNPTLLYCP